jgi:aryl sulfotransferase
VDELVVYKNPAWDSTRWSGFEFRADDILICTPPKSGTTWMQMLCAMLVFGDVEFDRPLTEISPWLEFRTTAVAEVFSALEAQQHRRFIKTHTPLDGLPSVEGVTYVCVARDPRDVALSYQHHAANLDRAVVMAALQQAEGAGDPAEVVSPFVKPPDDPTERFWLWVDTASGFAGPTLAEILLQIETFWDRRERRDVALFHYSDVLLDLPGQIRRLADVLAVDVSDEQVERFAEAATFDRMKERADDLAPDVTKGLWHNNQEFFHRGSNGQWQDLIDHDGLDRYKRRVADLVGPDVAAWAHTGWLGFDPASFSS